MAPVVRLLISALLLSSVVSGLRAQMVIGAKAGLVSYALGNVTVDGQAITVSGTRFPEVKEDSVLRTGRGLAEMLLGPCSALRLGHDTSVRLVASAVAHPALELLAGAAIVEISGIAKESGITLRLNSESILIAHTGQYRVEFLPAVLKVFDGRASVRDGSRSFEVAAGRLLAISTGASRRFDRRPSDELDRWSGRRTVELARTRAAGTKTKSTATDAATADHTSELPGYANVQRAMGQGRGEADVIAIMPTAPNPAPAGCIAGR